MKRIYLHIGKHKTGSTSLQKFFSHAFEQLLKDGVLYPVCGRPKVQSSAKYGHHLLAWSLLEKRGISGLDYWQHFKEEISVALEKTVLLSTEDFENSNESQIKQIAYLLRGMEVHIVVYLRNPYDHMLSSFKQRVKMGKYTKTFPSYIEEKIGQCDYDSLVKRWSKCFGSENVHVCYFDNCRKGEGLEAWFLKLLGLDINNYRKYFSKPVNVSQRDDKIIVIRWLNVLDKYSGGIIKKPIHLARRQILRNSRLGRMLVTFGGLISNHEIARVRDKCRIEEMTEGWERAFLKK